MARVNTPNIIVKKGGRAITGTGNAQYAIDKDKYAKNWDRIFKKKSKEEKK